MNGVQVPIYCLSFIIYDMHMSPITLCLLSRFTLFCINFYVSILVSPEAGLNHFGAHYGKLDKEKSAFAPVIRGSATPPAHTPAPALFHHQPVTGWHHLAVQC